MPVVVAPILLVWSALFLALLLWMMSQSGQTVIRSFFASLLSAIRRVPLIGSVIAHGIDWLIHQTVKPISDAALAVEAPIAGWFSHVAAVIERSAFATYYTAVHAYDALWKLRHAIIPHFVRTVITPVKIVAHGGLRISVAAFHAVATEATLAKRIAYRANARAWEAEREAAAALRHAGTVTLPRVVPKVEGAVSHAVAVAAGAVAAPLPWVEREITSARELAERALARVLGLPRWLTLAGVGGVAIWALGRIGGGWIKCGNWQKIGKQGCRLPGHWLDSLLALAADFLILRNICQILPWVERGFAEVATPLVELLTAHDAGLGCSTSGKPPDLEGEPVVYPAVLGTSLGGI